MGSLEDRARELAAQRRREREAAERKRQQDSAEAARRAEEAARPFKAAAREYVALARKYGVQPFRYGSLTPLTHELKHETPVWVVSPCESRPSGSDSRGIAVDPDGTAYYFDCAYMGDKIVLKTPSFFTAEPRNPYGHGMRLNHWNRTLEYAASAIVAGKPPPPSVRNLKR
jgi:hypothetical protein